MGPKSHTSDVAVPFSQLMVLSTERTNGPSRDLKFVYHLGVILGDGTRPQFYASFGP